MLERHDINNIRRIFHETHDTSWLIPLCNQAAKAINLSNENKDMEEHIVSIEFEVACLTAENEKLREEKELLQIKLAHFK